MVHITPSQLAAGVVACEALHALTHLSVVVPLELVFQLPPLAVLLLFDVHTQLSLYPPGCFPITWPERCSFKKGWSSAVTQGLLLGKHLPIFKGTGCLDAELDVVHDTIDVFPVRRAECHQSEVWGPSWRASRIPSDRLFSPCFCVGRWPRFHSDLPSRGCDGAVPLLNICIQQVPGPLCLLGEDLKGPVVRHMAEGPGSP